MDEPDDARPGWWNRLQSAMLRLVALADEAAKIADALRRIIR
jgi:hypothetical protein